MKWQVLLVNWSISYHTPDAHLLLVFFQLCLMKPREESKSSHINTMTFVLSKPVTKKCWLQHNLFMSIWRLLAGPVDPGNKKTSFHSLLKRRIAIIQNIQKFKWFLVMKNIIKTASKILTKSLTIKIPSLLFLKYVNLTVLVIKTVKEILKEFTSFTQCFSNYLHYSLFYM